MRNSTLLMLLLLGLGGLARLPDAHAGPIGLAWDFTGDKTQILGFEVQRCVVPTGATECTPREDLAQTTPTVLSYTDGTAKAGQTVCYAVWTVADATTRKGPGLTPDQKPYLCKVAPYNLPAAGPTKLQGLTVGVRLSWAAPLYPGTDATPDLLTRYDIWRRPNPGTAWSLVTTTTNTTLTWDDLTATTALAPGVCYEVRAVYNPIASVGNGVACAATSPPAGVPAPSNLRLVPQTMQGRAHDE